METTFTKLEKKQLTIFLLVAYGVTYLMGFLMWYGNRKGIDVSAFPNAQMMYPAAGVALAYLLTRREDTKIPKWFFRIFVLLTGIMITLAVVSVAMPEMTVPLGEMSISLWMVLIQYLMIIGSIVCWILVLAAGKERRAAYGLKWKNWKASIGCILLFLLLYIARTAISCAMSGQMSEFAELMKSSTTWMGLAVLPVNFFFVFVAFFGEEYGWRYYLQPLLQKKYGLRAGVLLLNVIWGLWHLPVDFFYYSPDSGLIMAAAQQITCITLGIFFAYAYMKTQNIWVPVALHYLNNNLIPVFSGNYSADVLQNQSITWGQLPAALLLNGVIFGLFLLTKTFSESEKTDTL